MDLVFIKEVGIAAANNGAKILMDHLGRISKIEKKGAIDLVTEADTGAEKAIIDTIREKFPDHSLLAEESGAAEGNTDHKWIIDPLDGTTNYAHQLGLFSISIAFELKGKIVAGIVLNPVTGELFTGLSEMGAELNGERISVSKSKTVSESLLVTGFPYDFKNIFTPMMNRLKNCLKASVGVRRLGSAALDLCYVACGRFDGFWEQNLKPWDTAAGILIAREAGAVITDFSNHTYSLDKSELLATNGRIHDEMLLLLEI